jgi:hypothetical protein
MDSLYISYTLPGKLHFWSIKAIQYRLLGEKELGKDWSKLQKVIIECHIPSLNLIANLLLKKLKIY